MSLRLSCLDKLLLLREEQDSKRSQCQRQCKRRGSVRSFLGVWGWGGEVERNIDPRDMGVKNLRMEPSLGKVQECLSLLGLPQQNRLRGLDSRSLFSHSSGCWKFKIRVPARPGSGEASLPDLQTSTFSLCPHIVFSLCTYVERGLLRGPPVLLD